MADTKRRSETNAVGNTKFPDLNMSRYPTQIDSRDPGNAGFNENMKGFWSAGDKDLPSGVDPDYNMAEHVNSIADAVMAIERILGINPHIDYKGGNTDGTVSDRIGNAENKDAYYDKRYGGENWKPEYGQTILTHTHGGGLTEAPQINLSDEVKGLLPKINIDLTQETGLTGDDISVSKTVSTKVSDAVNDKLSTSQGGTVKKDLAVEGKFSNRTYREWTAEDVTGGTAITDVKTMLNKARRFTGTSEQRIVSESLNNFLCGKYVLAVRLRTNSLASEAIAWFRFGNQKQSDGKWTWNTTKYISGSDFNNVNEWQMFYYVFDHETLDEKGNNALQIYKDDTATSINLDFDCAYVMPTHPAVFDK